MLVSNIRAIFLKKLNQLSFLFPCHNTNEYRDNGIVPDLVLRVCMCVCYLAADHGHDDVMVVSTGPAQDVGSLLVALLTKLLVGVLRTAGRTNRTNGQQYKTQR